MNVPIQKCLDCGATFENPGDDAGTWFECDPCGAVHVLVRGKWMLEDDAQPILEFDTELAELRR